MYDYDLKLVTAPTKEPLTVEQLRQEGGYPEDAETDAMLARNIKAARVWVENYLSRFLLEQTWDLLLMGFPCSERYKLHSNEIRVPRAPLKATGGIVRIYYLDSTGTQITTLAAVTDYEVAARSEPAVVVPAYGRSWPSTYPTLKNGNYPVEVRFTAGAAVAGGADPGVNVPENFRKAILLLACHWYENREASITGTIAEEILFGVEALLAQDRFFPW